MRVLLRRGDFPTTVAGALVTSANDALVGNGQLTYWRFISRTNADGALRKLGGPDLEAACEAIEPLSKEASSQLRRDITRWTSGVKHGKSALVRCPAGSAVATAAYGALQCDHVIHAVAPDSEFGYEGMYTGGLLDQRISGAVAGNDTPRAFAGGASDGIASQQFTPPDDLLLATYEAALSQAARLDVSSVALCALGTGVKGWKPAISAALGLEAAVRVATAGHTDASHAGVRGGGSGASGSGGALAAGDGAPSLGNVEFVLGGGGGFGKQADESWRAWTRVARELLGVPSGLDQPGAYEAAVKAGEALSWELDGSFVSDDWAARSHAGAAAGGALGIGHTPSTRLALERIAEFRDMWQWRQLGKNGKDEPLTPEQELAAVGRRTKGPGE